MQRPASCGFLSQYAPPKQTMSMHRLN
jgi:hypothetical protein